MTGFASGVVRNLPDRLKATYRIARREFATVLFLCVTQALFGALLLGLLGSSAEAQGGTREGLLPLRAFRLCNTSLLKAYGKNELNPKDMAGKVADPSFIVDASVLAVRTEYPDGACNAECRRKVSEAFVSSLNLWRQQCLRCGAGMFAFLMIDDVLYVEQNIASVFSDLNVDRDKRILNSHAVLITLTGDRATGNGHVFGSYVRMERDNPAVSDFCSRALSQVFAQLWPSRLRSMICTGSDTDPAPTATVTFVKAEPCGSAEFIACGRPETGIELDLAKTAYVFRDDPTKMSVDDAPVLLGSASGDKIDLEAVLIHEIGHYLGLGHLEPENLPAKAPAVMLATLDDDSCVSFAETMMLNSAASAGWRYRLEPCAGLRRRPGPKR